MDNRLRKLSEREAHRAKVWARHPANVRYAKAAFKKGKEHQPKKSVRDSNSAFNNNLGPGRATFRPQNNS